MIERSLDYIFDCALHGAEGIEEKLWRLTSVSIACLAGMASCVVANVYLYETWGATAMLIAAPLTFAIMLPAALVGLVATNTCFTVAVAVEYYREKEKEECDERR